MILTSKESVTLEGLLSVRAWYLCSSEATEQNPEPNRTTSVKMYIDKNNRVYLAGDYILGKDGNQLQGFCKKVFERNIIVAHQSLQEKNTKVIIRKDPGVAGSTTFKENKEYLTNLGLSVVQAKGSNKSLQQQLGPVQGTVIRVLLDTFDKEASLTFNDAWDRATSTSRIEREDTGILSAIADAYNTLIELNQNKETNKKENNMTNQEKETLLMEIVESNRNWSPEQVEDFFNIIVKLREAPAQEVKVEVSIKKPLYKKMEKSHPLKYYLDAWWEEKVKTGGGVITINGLTVTETGNVLTPAGIGLDALKAELVDLGYCTDGTKIVG